MALDFGAGGSVQGQHLAGALVLGEPNAKVPALGCRTEVLTCYPCGGFVRVASFGPAPELPIDMIIQPAKGPLGGSMPVVIGPAPNDGVEFAQERFL